MLPIACKWKGIGAATWGPNPWGGGGGGGETEDGTIYTYILRNLWGYVSLPQFPGEPCPKIPCQLLSFFCLKMPLPPSSLGHADIAHGWLEWTKITLQVTCQDVTWVEIAVETFKLVKSNNLNKDFSSIFFRDHLGSLELGFLFWKPF